MKPSKAHLLICLFLMQVFSLVTIWSTAPELFVSQLMFTILCAIVILLISRLPISVFLDLSWILYAVSVLLLVITALVGRDIRGSVRWIDLGFYNLQTSEAIKPLLACFYATYLANIPRRSMRHLLFFLLICALPVVLVARQPDLGSALTLLFFPLAMLACLGYMRHLVVIGLLALLVIVPLESHFLKPYQRQRIHSFLNPYSDPQGAGYNVIQANIAIGSGGFLGKGVRLGTQSQLSYLPERHTDFIFASFAEEFGFFGVSLLLALYLFLLRFLFKMSSLCKDRRSQLLVLAVLFIILFQLMVNTGMNLGIMPVTGITLPLFSYGGSSLLSFAVLLGMTISLLDLITPFEL